MIVAGAGLCALGVDHFILRPDGRLESAAAAIVIDDSDSPLDGETKAAAAKVMVDRSGAFIAERLDRVVIDHASRNAFSEPWAIEVVPEGTVADKVEIVTVPVIPVIAPWKLTSVSSIGGKIAVVLEMGKKSLVLRVGSGVSENAELLEASDVYDKDTVPYARVREVSTGREFLLKLDPSAATSEKR